MTDQKDKGQTLTIRVTADTSQAMVAIDELLNKVKQLTNAVEGLHGNISSLEIVSKDSQT